MNEPAPGLQVDSDRAFQERFWVWERAGWIGMLLFVIAALAGLTGVTGPLSGGKAEAGEATIHYPRISRWQASDDLMVEFTGEAASPVEVVLPRSFTDVFAIESVIPQPARVTATPQGQVFEFELSGNSGPRHANFLLRPTRQSWPARARASVAGRPVDLSFTVLP